jgi:hypothetical protein
MDAADVLTRIRAAFPEYPLPELTLRQAQLGDQTLSREITDDELRKEGERDRGVPWTQIEDATLRECDAALSFIDDAGFVYYLPAFLSAASPGVYSGTLYTTTGPAFNAVPFNPAQVKLTQVGTATLSFSDANDATFAYTVNGISQMKNITRQVFGPLPVCATATASLTAATNYTDLWWAAPAGSESGWGINFTHQGNTIFATWFTYDLDGTPMWLSVTAPSTAAGVFSGALYRTTGPAFNAVPFNTANVALTPVGTSTFTFSDGNDASFAYTVNGISQTKAITRQVFQAPGTVCQ